MEKNFLHKLYQEHQTCPQCPSPDRVNDFFETLLGTLFPHISEIDFRSEKEFEVHVLKLKLQLDQLLRRMSAHPALNVDEIVDQFFDRVPQIHAAIWEDIEGMYEGDPAAQSTTEIIRSYPGFLAISSYRIAHELYHLEIPEIPRMITEQAHSRTGIDIHPGAHIGTHFCIDHGTGVVIGETTVIGNHVKIYQGVTLGALSVNKADAEKKRHPTIEDHVVVYAGATILGGDTIVGHHSVVGGNVWLTRSIPPYSKVYYQATMYDKNTNETDLFIFKEGEQHRS
jgi:serine O-acetyltransferase